MSLSSGIDRTEASLRSPALALTLGCVAVASGALSFVFESLNLAAGVQDFPYASGNALLGLIAGVVGAVIGVRRPGLSVGWLMLAAAVLSAFNGLAGEFGPYAYSSSVEGLRPVGAWSSWLASWVWIVASWLLELLVLVFPTGRLLSPRWLIVVWVGGAAAALSVFAEALPPGWLYWSVSIPNPAGVAWAAPLVQLRPVFFILQSVAIGAAAALSTIVRFWGARGVERQQIKWFAFAHVLFALVWAAASMIDTARADRVLRTSPAITVVGLSLEFGSIAIAVLRYRLFDIDLIINRTLVYTLVTALLGGSFAALSVVAQRLTLAVTGQESQIAVVVAALVVTALFQPLRSRVQLLVDHRFYRTRYDASRTLERFATRARDEVELDSLTSSLVGVVKETMQPDYVSLWLRPLSDQHGQARQALITAGGER